MSVRMGTELTDKDYRFNEYRRLNAFSDINYKLEIDMRKLLKKKKQLLKQLKDTQDMCEQ
jgi:F0F1-type ATP synthase alpha subunit